MSRASPGALLLLACGSQFRGLLSLTTWCCWAPALLAFSRCALSRLLVSLLPLPRPYTNWERQFIDVSVVDFDTVMGAIGSNNERWGIKDVELELERGAAPVTTTAAAPVRQAAAPVRPVAPSVAVEATAPGGAVLTCGTLVSTDTALRTVLLAGGAPV